MSILLISNDPCIRSSVTCLLQDAEYADLLVAESTMAALEYLNVHHPLDAEAKIDLVLLDITTPGVNGMNTIQPIKSATHLRDIPVIIMMTTPVDEAQMEHAMAIGFTDYVTKPVNRFDLLSRVRSALTLKREIERRKSLGSELEHKKQELEQVSSAKNRILSMVSHELKTPLTSIIGYVDSVLDQDSCVVAPLGERQQRYLQTALRNATRMEALINDLLAISSIESDNLQLNVANLELRQEIEEVVRSMQNQFDEKGIQLVLNLPARLPQIKADKLRFAQIMSNLLSNACKYSPIESEVSVVVKIRQKLAQIDVVDNGMGLSAADQQKLFSQFFRSNNPATRDIKGTGLGLFITKCLIEAHGGRIWVNTEEGKGSIFSFTIPTTRSASQTAETNGNQKEGVRV